MNQFQLIEDTNDLIAYCQKASGKDVIAIDTEFVRTRTLNPELGLIQIYDGEDLALVDPIKTSDMSAFWQLLVDPKVIKVLHSCSEDLEVFKTYAGALPAPMIDTQIACAFLGHGISMGFAALVKHTANIELDKGEARTNWLARPLSPRQLEYAANDVFYLLPAYHQLVAELAQRNLLELVKQESLLICKKRSFERPHESLYFDIKNAWQLSSRSLAVLRELTIWRKKQAVKKNLAINFVVKEQNLFEVAKRRPNSYAQLSAIPGMQPFELKYHAKALLKCVERGNSVPPELCPQPLSRLIDFPNYKQVFKQIKAEIKHASVQSGIAEEIIASKKQINQYLTWHWKLEDADRALHIKPDLLVGWRFELVGEKLDKVIGAVVE